VAHAGVAITVTVTAVVADLTVEVIETAEIATNLFVI
jgi:hypothetical protein